ncbi:hypothetical protein [Nocardiopsis sp. MG754419]|uniref:hypothetical protein n=1 Tax=Nocardiopsis sp. MG754419 TaxID=2259865 RepID=UPI001BAB679F|nr:hypothetical protein [Nocardiopsis sp. MG754419]MBR8741451.1 hypothetical protein [Nocardiopsis sp. MG754419]
MLTRTHPPQPRELGPFRVFAVFAGMIVTLFDLLATAIGEPFTEEELASELDRASSGTWWTLARRDQAPPDWTSWQHWYRG